MDCWISLFLTLQGDFGSEDFASGSFDFGSQDFGSQDFGSQDFASQDFPSDFGPGPLYGMSASPFLRRVDPQEIGNQGETPIGRWGSRKPSETPAAPRTPVKNGKRTDNQNTNIKAVPYCQLLQNSGHLYKAFTSLPHTACTPAPKRGKVILHYCLACSKHMQTLQLCCFACMLLCMSIVALRSYSFIFNC